MSGYYGSGGAGYSSSPPSRGCSSPSLGYTSSQSTAYPSSPSSYGSRFSGQDRLAADVAARYSSSSARYGSPAQSTTSSSYPFSPSSIGRSATPSARAGYSDTYASLGYGRPGASDFTPLGAFDTQYPGRGTTTTTSSYPHSRGSDRLAADAAARYGFPPPSSRYGSSSPSPPCKYFSPDSFHPRSRSTANSRSGGYGEVYSNLGYGEAGRASFAAVGEFDGERAGRARVQTTCGGGSSGGRDRLARDVEARYGGSGRRESGSSSRR